MAICKNIGSVELAEELIRRENPHTVARALAIAYSNLSAAYEFGEDANPTEAEKAGKIADFYVDLEERLKLRFPISA